VKYGGKAGSLFTYSLNGPGLCKDIKPVFHAFIDVSKDSSRRCDRSERKQKGPSVSAIEVSSEARRHQSVISSVYVCLIIIFRGSMVREKNQSTYETNDEDNPWL
jgi:hypothetical protein